MALFPFISSFCAVFQGVTLKEFYMDAGEQSGVHLIAKLFVWPR